jgi:hypothetical protein
MKGTREGLRTLLCRVLLLHASRHRVCLHALLCWGCCVAHAAHAAECLELHCGLGCLQRTPAAAAGQDAVSAPPIASCLVCSHTYSPMRPACLLPGTVEAHAHSLDGSLTSLSHLFW